MLTELLDDLARLREFLSESITAVEKSRFIARQKHHLIHLTIKELRLTDEEIIPVAGIIGSEDFQVLVVARLNY